jgi:NTE family protein
VLIVKKKYPIGIALSGGGFCCAAQIGVLKCLREAGVVPDIISGTSGGAIVGALYAKGLNCDEIIQVFKSVNLFSIPHYTFKKPGIFDIETYHILEKYLTEDNFSSLNIPLTISATNLERGKTVYFNKGELIKPLLASAAFPGIFAPVKINNQLFADGGILENLPTKPIRDQCDVLIGIDVNPIPSISDQGLSTTTQVFDRVVRLSLRHQQSFKQDSCDILISPNEIARYHIMAKDEIEELMKIGYQEGKRYLPKIASLIKEA